MPARLTDPIEQVLTREQEQWTFEEPCESLPTGTASCKPGGEWKEGGSLPYLRECKSGRMFVGSGGLAEMVNAGEFFVFGGGAGGSGGTANTSEFSPAAFGGSRVLQTSQPVLVSYAGVGKSALLVSALFRSVVLVGGRHLPKDQEDRLARLSDLAEGWDSYGGRRITKEALRNARKALFRVDSEGMSQNVFIAPSPDGGIDLEWQSKSGAEFILEIPPSGTKLVLYTRTGDVEKESTIEEFGALDLLLGGTKV